MSLLRAVQLITSTAVVLTAWAGAGADPEEEARMLRRQQWGGREYQPPRMPERVIFPTGGFTFCRVRYTSYGEDPDTNRRHARWLIDYPDSDQHFSWRLSELTTINVEKNVDGEFKTAIVRLTDPELYNYPFIYLIEPGDLIFSEDEVTALRNYLLRGGFLMVDDFWGTDEWMNWAAQFARVFDPLEFPMAELDLSHPIFNCVFEIKERPQVPNPWHWVNSGGGTSERGSDSAVVHYMGVHDKNQRLMAIFCHNTDLGDGWERETMFEDYFREMSAKKAYPMGINIVVYALTH